MVVHLVSHRWCLQVTSLSVKVMAVLYRINQLRGNVVERMFCNEDVFGSFVDLLFRPLQRELFVAHTVLSWRHRCSPCLFYNILTSLSVSGICEILGCVSLLLVIGSWTHLYMIRHIFSNFTHGRLIST